MTKKFFSLILGKDIHVAPQTKVIPAEEFSEMLNAKEVLEMVKQDAEAYRIQVTAECEEIKEQAKQEGFKEGFRQWAEQIAYLESIIEEEKQTFKDVVVPVAIQAAKKIVGQHLAIQQDAIIDIVLQTLKAVAQHKKVTIWVNRDDFESVEANREKIKKIFEDLRVLSIRVRDDVQPGGCIVETEGGIINAQLENRWHILEQAFSKMMNSSGKTKSQRETEEVKS